MHVFTASSDQTRFKNRESDKHTLHSKSFFVPKTSSRRSHQKRNLSTEVVHHRLFVDILTSENFYWLKHRMESLVAVSTRSRGFSWCCHSLNNFHSWFFFVLLRVIWSLKIFSLACFVFSMALVVSQRPIFENLLRKHSRNYDVCLTSHEKYYLETLTMCFECFFKFIYSTFP